MENKRTIIKLDFNKKDQQDAIIKAFTVDKDIAEINDIVNSLDIPKLYDKEFDSDSSKLSLGLIVNGYQYNFEQATKTTKYFTKGKYYYSVDFPMIGTIIEGYSNPDVLKYMKESFSNIYNK